MVSRWYTSALVAIVLLAASEAAGFAQLRSTPFVPQPNRGTTGNAALEERLADLEKFAQNASSQPGATTYQVQKLADKVAALQSEVTSMTATLQDAQKQLAASQAKLAAAQTQIGLLSAAQTTLQAKFTIHRHELVGLHFVVHDNLATLAAKTGTDWALTGPPN